MLKNKVVACHTIHSWRKCWSEKTWDEYSTYLNKGRGWLLSRRTRRVSHLVYPCRIASGEIRGKWDSILLASATLYKSLGTSIKSLIHVMEKGTSGLHLLVCLALRAAYPCAQQTCHSFAPQEDLFCPSNVADTRRSVHFIVLESRQCVWFLNLVKSQDLKLLDQWKLSQFQFYWVLVHDREYHTPAQYRAL